MTAASTLRAGVAAALVAGVVFLLAPLAGRALTAFRARGAVVSYCGEQLASMPRGTMVRLSRCGVDMFHASFRREADGGASRLVPLRPPAGSASEPSALALAVPVESASDPAVFKSRPAAHSAESAIADLDDTLALVGDRIDVERHPPDAVPGFEHGLAPQVTVLEVRTAAPIADARLRLMGAGVLLLVALGVFFGRRPLDSHDEPDEDERPPVRWGLVLVAVLVGVIGLARAMQWYLDPIREAGIDPIAQEVPIGTAAAPAPSADAPPATTAELALLASADPGNRLTAAAALRSRAITPDLVAAVDAALGAQPERDLEAQLVCIKARFANEGSLDFLIGRIPRDRADVRVSRTPELACVVDALAARIRDAPERISLALVPIVFGSHPSSRAVTLAAYRLIDVPIPVTVTGELAAPSPDVRRVALAAAMALGAVQKRPAIVETALRDAEMRRAVLQELRTNPHHHAGRMVASAWLDLDASDIDMLANDREREQHDVSAALLEIATDTLRPESRRAEAAAKIGRLGEVGAVHELRRIGESAAPGELKSAAETAVRALEKQQAGGVPPRMRALPR